MQGLVTIEEHLCQYVKNHRELPSDLPHLLSDVNLAAKVIRNEVIRFGLTDQQGRSGVENVHGETTQKLDIYANEAIKTILGKHGRFSVIGSEEEETIVNSGNLGAAYAILFDPLDGSSNIDVNVSVGTIFSIYRLSKPDHQGSLSDCLKLGSEQVASGYIIYGSSVVMVYTAGHGVHGFTYDPNLGDFFLSHESIRIPEQPTCYSMNDALWTQVSPTIQNFIESYRMMPKMSGRYVGSLVADFHRNLLKGGIYLYPSTPDKPLGKLRLLYEANPLAFICEQAGGYASNGQQSILTLKPTALHERTPLFIGSRDLVENLELALNQKS